MYKYKCILKVLNQIYKEKQSEYNELMSKCNEQLKSDESSNDSSAQNLQCPLKTLPIR